MKRHLPILCVLVAACKAPATLPVAATPTPTAVPSPVATAPRAEIVFGGSWVEPGYSLVVERDGRYTLSVAGASPRTGTLGPALATALYTALDADRPLAHLPPTQCSKSAALGAVTTVRYDGERTPDLSCPSCDERVGALSYAAAALYAAATSASPPPKPSPTPISVRVPVDLTAVAGVAGAGGQDGDGNTATFALPGPLALTAAGGLLVLESAAGRLRRLDQLDAGPVTRTLTAKLKAPVGVAVTPDGQVWVAEAQRLLTVGADGAGVVQVSPPGAQLQSLTALPDGRLAYVDGGLLGFYDPAKRSLGPTTTPARVVAAGKTGLCYATRTQVFAYANGVSAPLAGADVAGRDDGPGATARFDTIAALALDPAGHVFVADGNRVRVIDPDGRVRTLGVDLPGVGEPCFGTEGPLTQLSQPGGLVVDKAGELLVADTLHQRVMRVAVHGL